MENNMRFGGHNMGKAPVLLGALMKAIIKAAIVDHATNCAIKPAWWTEEDGGEELPSSAASSTSSTNTTPG
jgi:hypothetical protein